MKSIHRRTFLKAAGLGGAGLALPNIITSKALGAADGTPPASERIVMAGVGVGGQGSGDLKTFMADKRVQLVAVCDVREAARRQWEQQVKDIKSYVDYREVIARNDIDMIMCATPDHWHAQISIDAMKCGKDIYCEKPVSLTIAEGRKMVTATRAYGRVFSCGSQRVIGDYGKFACAARSGRYGKILEARSYPGEESRMCTLPGAGDPKADGIEWDLWLGPAPWAPYNIKRCSAALGIGGGGFRSWHDYSGGMTTDLGAHRWGGAMHGLGVDDTGPTQIIYPGNQDCEFLTMVFAKGLRLVAGHVLRPGYLCEGGVAEPFIGMPVPPPGLRWYEDGAKSPQEDLINCILQRRRPFQDVEYAHRVATACHLANICRSLKRDLKWDPDKEEFIGDEQANRLVDRPRRGPWQI